MTPRSEIRVLFLLGTIVIAACSSEKEGASNGDGDSSDISDRLLTGNFRVPERFLATLGVTDANDLITTARDLLGPDFEANKAALRKKLTGKGWVESQKKVGIQGEKDTVLTLRRGDLDIQSIQFSHIGDQLTLSTQIVEGVGGKEIHYSNLIEVNWQDGRFEAVNTILTDSVQLIPEFVQATEALGVTAEELQFTSVHPLLGTTVGGEVRATLTGEQIRAMLGDLGFVKTDDIADPSQNLGSDRQMTRTIARDRFEITQVVRWANGLGDSVTPIHLSLDMTLERDTGVVDRTEISLGLIDAEAPEVGNFLLFSGNCDGVPGGCH